MQSIYLFRDAESRLFHQVREHGMEMGSAHLPLTALQLSTNFRSTPAIVNPLNEVFERVLGADADDEVQYAASVSSKADLDRGVDALASAYADIRERHSLLRANWTPQKLTR